MTTIDVNAAAKGSLAPIDDSVKIPDSVKQQAARANSYYQPDPAAAPAAEPAKEPANTPTLPAGNEPEPQPNQQVSAPAEPVKEPATPPQPAAPASEPPVADEMASLLKRPPQQLAQMYLSMKGRFDQAMDTIDGMQQQMQELGTELARTQQLVTNQGVSNIANPQPTKKLITEQDETNFGSELIDVARRAAQEVVQPQVEALQNENNQLRQQVTRQQRASLNTQLSSEVPDWQKINRDPRFLQWLSLRDIYSGRVRKVMLNEAYQAANAPRVVAFFKGFLQEEAATGHLETPVPLVPEPSPTPREPAVQLESLAAPGRSVRPAGGNTVVEDKPVFTRQQISQFYKDAREGRYAGREAERNRVEAAIFLAQKEGRIR